MAILFENQCVFIILLIILSIIINEIEGNKATKKSTKKKKEPTPDQDQDELLQAGDPETILKNIVEVRKERFRRYGTTSLLRQQTKRWVEWEVEQELKKNQGNKEAEIGDYDEHKTDDADEKKVVEENEPEKKEQNKIVYKQKAFVELCEDPVFDSVETNLDATEILIIKGEKFYIMERLKFGSGQLVASGQTSDLLPGFVSNGFEETVTVKEGPMRGHVYAFYNDGSVMVWRPSGWSKMQPEIGFKKTKVKKLPKTGFKAALYRRDVEHPLLMGLIGKKVYYYNVVNMDFKLVNETTHDKSVEKFPKDLTAATSQPNGFIYLFRGKEYCVREMFHQPASEEAKDPYCDLWRDTTRFLGCYGSYRPPLTVLNTIMRKDDYNDDDNVDDPDEKSAYQIEFCDYNYISDLTLQVDGIVYIFKEDSWYYTVFQFPDEVKFTGSDSALDKWNNFHEDPDAFMIVQEGPMRGHAFEFKGDKYYHWTVDGVLKEDGKGLKELGAGLDKLEAILDNNDILEPMAVGFGKDKVHYLDLNSTSIKLIKSVKYSESKELWPTGITAALFINPEKVYLVRKGKYCKRPWQCQDKKNNCCKKWMDSKILFSCNDKEKDKDQ